MELLGRGVLYFNYWCTASHYREKDTTVEKIICYVSKMLLNIVNQKEDCNFFLNMSRVLYTSLKFSGIFRLSGMESTF